MEEFIREVRRVAQSAYSKLSVFLKEANPVALQLTETSSEGTEGTVTPDLAARDEIQHPEVQQDPSFQNSCHIKDHGAVTGSVKPGKGFAGAVADSVPIPLSDLRSQLPGIKTVTISAPGVLLEEWDPERFEESATVRPDAAEIVKELASTMHVYILAHVESDVGEMVIRAALEAVNILGPGIRQLPPHRLVFCEKLKGKVSLVRQIEPQLHIDGSSETLEELQRFIPHLYHVVRKGNPPAACKTSLVACGPTLADAMNVQVFN